VTRSCYAAVIVNRNGSAHHLYSHRDRRTDASELIISVFDADVAPLLSGGDWIHMPIADDVRMGLQRQGVLVNLQVTISATTRRSAPSKIGPFIGIRRTRRSARDGRVSTRRGIMCSHREEAYREIPMPHSLAHSEAAQDHCILLRLFHQTTETDQQRIAEALKRAWNFR
jgi:hypothetical protein